MVVDKAIGVLRMGITCCWELSVVTSVEVCLKKNTYLQRIINLWQKSVFDREK